MVQGLMRLTNIVGAETSRHRFHTLALPGKQQAGAIGLQRDHAIQVPRGMRQAVQISREAVFLGAWRKRMSAHDQQLTTTDWQIAGVFGREHPVYNTVVLAGCGKTRRSRRGFRESRLSYVEQFR